MKFFVYHGDVYGSLDPTDGIMYRLDTGGFYHPSQWIWQAITPGLGSVIWNEYLKEINHGKTSA
jgi:hypothetical protein